MNLGRIDTTPARPQDLVQAAAAGDSNRAEPRASRADSADSFAAAAEAAPPADAPGKDAVKPVAGPPSSQMLRIEYDADAARFVHYGVDAETGAVVSQVPTQEALRRIAYLRERLDAILNGGR